MGEEVGYFELSSDFATVGDRVMKEEWYINKKVGKWVVVFGIIIYVLGIVTGMFLCLIL